MTLISGKALDPKRFFKGGAPIKRSSSFDLTVGTIFDHTGKEIDGHYTLKPGHMVQVVSAEEFNLGDDVTGHVTYKTSMTREGIWALTVGIVDPGWCSPISTTLLNFSRNDFPVHPGDPFLRVSFFEHQKGPVQKTHSQSKKDYNNNLQKIAAAKFPSTFLNSDEIAKQAGKQAMKMMRNQALMWVAVIGFLLALIQFVILAFAPVVSNFISAKPSAFEELQVTKSELERTQLELVQIRGENARLKTQSERAVTTIPLPARATPPSFFEYLCEVFWKN